ncbi:hypothetical protein RRG08_062639 [Elysia crispata]|uniref:Uncharacterized protein n=1 Tax=Elysia crispata TaxID=231223 RepID=A0AAE0Z095_9GAST|nr:hypothetical protein RRG08_062639 [Elysia crispata]
MSVSMSRRHQPRHQTAVFVPSQSVLRDLIQMFPARRLRADQNEMLYFQLVFYMSSGCQHCPGAVVCELTQVPSDSASHWTRDETRVTREKSDQGG